MICLFSYCLSITGFHKVNARPVYLYRPTANAGDKASPYNSLDTLGNDPQTLINIGPGPAAKFYFEKKA
jgi:hypothetical protein